MSDHATARDADEIAIIAMTGRFPGARSIDEFWSNLYDGVETISFFSDAELEASGVDRALLNHPNYVKAGAVLEDVERFDAALFNINPREAEIIDPQQRLFLECSWEVFECAGYDTETYRGRIGVFAGTFMSRYLFHLYAHPSLIDLIGETAIRWGNDKDYLAPRVSYKLDLKGPSINVNTSCSTSLVAVHLACQSLLNGECDMALAGGVAIASAEKAGYIYREGDIVSPDGHCRAFDAQAQGTMFGSGVGVVLLKRMADAIADNDHIHAVIKGSAVNNDGACKIGFTAPSVEGQAEVIAEALGVANIDPETISYIETHGTGTPLGDPIEIEALTHVFRASTEKKGFCAIASVKTNVGHLGTAAGVTGLIKTVLALQHRMIPPSLNFVQPNPKIHFADSPFYVNTTLSEWREGRTPRRAGVSSFGIGGTNAHVVLEEAPLLEDSGPSRPWQLLMLSARTSTALERATANLVAHLKQYPDQPIADVVYTLQVGRRAFNHRRVLVCQSRDDAVAALETLDPQRVLGSVQVSTDRPVMFMFPGQGAQHIYMAYALYQTEPTFRSNIDRCCDLLRPHLGLDLRDILYPGEEEKRGRGGEGENGQSPISNLQSPINQTQYTQPALFVVEYALAQLWMEWGIHPTAMIGHSIGEYVAACLAGVFSLEDALALVVARGRVVQQLPEGAMLAVMLPEQEVRALLKGQLCLAAVNGPAACVVSGPTEEVQHLERQLIEHQITCRRLHVSHAFHSAMLDSILAAFTEQVRQVNLNPPRLPYLSNVTGTWITATEATTPSYWARHLRETVRWADGLHTLLQQANPILLEVGPGQTLSTLARQQPEYLGESLVLCSLGRPHRQHSDVETILDTVGKLWLAGISIDWPKFYAHECRHRVRLPAYPFERQRYWIERDGNTLQRVGTPEPLPQALATPQSAPVPAVHSRPNVQMPYVGPRNEVEQGIAELYQQLLGITEVGIYDDFFELGGHSLLVTQLMTRLRDLYQVQLPMHSLFDTPTIAGIAQTIDRIRREGMITEEAVVRDLWAEAVLDSSIQPEARLAEPVAEPAHIFLTGVTGFLGAFLLDELLRQTQAQIYCLVRASDTEEGYQRIRRTLESYQLRDAGMSSRITPIVGDLSQPLLGLSNQHFQRLAASIDVIYHNGALVNFIRPYHVLKATNVLGTQEVLRLACKGKAKPLHFISSIGVLTSAPGQPVVFSEDDISQPEGLHSGYNQSKWVAEQLVRVAASRGLAVSIYRPGNIAGHSRTGACNINDFLLRTIKSWVQLAIAPDTAAMIDVTPIDYVSRSLVYLSRQQESLGKTFHLVNPNPVSVRTIIDWMHTYGYPFQLIAPHQWASELIKRAEHFSENALYPLLPLFASAASRSQVVHNEEVTQADMVRYACQNTLEGLAGTPIVCPPITDTLLATYFSYLVRSEFLQAPSDQP
jgi:phthiocerol/phenolphthiocerol synthesis type-I polyketide synthase E